MNPDVFDHAAVDLLHLRQWIGRGETSTDHLQATPIAALAATLDLPAPPVEWLPPCWHWLFFLPRHRHREIGPDGHPRRGGFLPDVPLPRRMWAGSQLVFHRALRIGSPVCRQSEIIDVSMKEGRSGPLVFVRAQHRVDDAEGLAITELQDIVYRRMPLHGEASTAPVAARTDEQFSQAVAPDAVLLFRYSALTFNGHRIHYDRPYATQVEGYPGLVVHGPLVATLLIEQLREHTQRRIDTFEFRAVNALLEGAPFTLCGRIDGDTATLWARGPQGGLAMQAKATLAPS